MRTFLVATDFSKDAHDALLYAIDLASEMEAQLVLLHAFYEPISYPYHQDFTQVVNELERGRCAKLEAYANKVLISLQNTYSLDFISSEATDYSHNAGDMKKRKPHSVVEAQNTSKKAAVQLRCECKYGIAFDEILKAISVHQAELVLMGMRGASGLRRALLGRTVIQVMRDAQVPVLAVPLDMRFNGFSSVTFAVDLQALPPKPVLHLLRSYMRRFHSKLQVLHLYTHRSLQSEKDNAATALRELDQQLSDIDFKVTFQHEFDFAEGIFRFVREQHADLLILVPQQHTFLEKLLQRSLTDKMLAKAFVPLLALPAHSSGGTHNNLEGESD